MANNDLTRPWVARKIESILPNSEGDQHTTDTTVRLPWRQKPPLNEAEMASIAEALSRNARVKVVNIIFCLRGSPAAAASTFLEKILKTHQSIKRIEIL